MSKVIKAKIDNEVKLIRKYKDTCVIGELFLNGLKLADTLELPFKNNKREESAIPSGAYIVRRETNKKFGKCYRVLNVKNRDGILIHVGNSLKDTKGCILVGKKLLFTNRLFNSRKTIDSLYDFKINKLIIS